MGGGITKHCAVDTKYFLCGNDTNKARKIWFVPLSFKSFSSNEFIHIHPPGIRGTCKKSLWK